MADDQRKFPYNERDWAIMANDIFRQLCSIGPGWHDISLLTVNVIADEDKVDVAYIAEDVLVGTGYIERDMHTINVRLTELGRQNCDRDIEIPPSYIQRLRTLLEIVHVSDRLDLEVTRADNP